MSGDIKSKADAIKHGKLMSYLEQENEVLHARIRKLEAAHESHLLARVLKSDDEGRPTVIAVDDKAYIAAWSINTGKVVNVARKAATEAEREACATVAEQYGISRANYESDPNTLTETALGAAKSIAHLIRSRGEQG